MSFLGTYENRGRSYAWQTERITGTSQYADVEMWSVVGKDAATAIAELEAKNLVVEPKYEENYGKADGIVLSQSVEAGTIIKEQSVVTLIINDLPDESTVTFNVNVASYYPSAAVTEPEDDEETNTTVTETPSVETVSIQVYIGGVPVQSASALKTEKNWVYSYKTSGTQRVQIIIDGSERYNQNVDFSAGDTTITVSK